MKPPQMYLLGQLFSKDLLFEVVRLLRKIDFKKCFEIVGFPLWRRDPVLELQIVAICEAAVRNSIAFSNSASADRNGMAASRFLAAAAARVILFVFCI